VEIWSDEATGKCTDCGTVVIRTETQSCVDWCKYARDCLGDEKYKKYGEMKAAMRKPAIIDAISRTVGDNTDLLEPAKKSVFYAEAILKEESDPDPNLVIAASLLHNLPENSCREILKELEYPEAFIDLVAEMTLKQAAAGRDAEANTKILHDAILLAAHEGSISEELPDEMLTIKGRRIARELSRD
jgi:hypothetical protein